jgi:hypothetical protein
MSENAKSFCGSSDSAPKREYCLVTRQSRRGPGVETVVVEGVFNIRTFLMLCVFLHNFMLGMPCACCDRSTPYIPLYVDDDDSPCQTITVCPGCNAGICGQCTGFVENFDIANGKLCRYCGTHVAPLCKISLNGPRPLSLRKLTRARNQFYIFSRWVSSVRSKDRDFDFSAIFWSSYFDHLSWRFFVDAEWFFDQQLPGQLKIVMAGIYFNGSHLLNMKFRKGFAGPYHDFHKDAAEDQPPNFIFPQLMNVVKMHSFAFKMLERMDVFYLDLIRKRLRTVWEQNLSIGLGVNIPKVNYPEDSFWR